MLKGAQRCVSLRKVKGREMTARSPWTWPMPWGLRGAALCRVRVWVVPQVGFPAFCYPIRLRHLVEKDSPGMDPDFESHPFLARDGQLPEPWGHFFFPRALL